MKYIRTKCGKIVEHPHPNADVFTFRYEIEKQADTIEELCDEFVIFDENQNGGLPLSCPKEKVSEIKPYIRFGMINGFNVWIKGAIWIDKGLIYVAKMNEKGELELL